MKPAMATISEPKFYFKNIEMCLHNLYREIHPTNPPNDKNQILKKNYDDDDAGHGQCGLFYEKPKSFMKSQKVL